MLIVCHLHHERLQALYYNKIGYLTKQVMVPKALKAFGFDNVTRFGIAGSRSRCFGIEGEGALTNTQINLTLHPPFF